LESPANCNKFSFFRFLFRFYFQLATTTLFYIILTLTMARNSGYCSVRDLFSLIQLRQQPHTISFFRLPLPKMPTGIPFENPAIPAPPGSPTLHQD
jgi:hypothetical protein